MSEYWYQKPLRMLQTVLREIDAENYDPESVVAYMKAVHADVLIVNGGGIYDFFQSAMLTANPVKQMGSRDILREITEVCHREGIKVIARVDFRGVREEVFRRCPESWFGRDSKGGIRMTEGTTPLLYAPCYMSYYRNEYASEFIDYLIDEYDIDGIWHNALLIGGICYCDRCRERYLKDTGKEIPVEGDSRFTDADFDEYWRWKSCRADDNLRLMRDTVKKHGDDKAYAGEVFNMLDTHRSKSTGIDFYQVAPIFDYLVSVAFLTENTIYPKLEDFEYPGMLIRFLRSIEPEKSPVVLYGTNGTAHRLVMDPPRDLSVWMWETVASGGGFWNCVFNGVHPGATEDRRNAYISGPQYSFIESNQDFLDGAQPYADVLVYYSKASKDSFGSEDALADEYVTELKGIVRALSDAHIQYGFVNDAKLSIDSLKDAKVLILPNAAALGDEEAEIIRAYVREGGKLISSYRTSLFDRSGNKRADFALSDIMGVSYADVEDTYKDSYQWIDDKESPVFSRIHDTSMIMANCLTAVCRLQGDAHMAASLVPCVNNQPPEQAWRSVYSSGNPTIVMNRYGKGESVYFASEIGKCIYMDGHDDFVSTFISSVRYLADDDFILSGNVPECVHVSVLQHGDSLMLSLVNTASSPRRPLTSVIPVMDLSIRIKGKSCRTVWGESVHSSVSGDYVDIMIDRLDDFASCIISLR